MAKDTKRYENQIHAYLDRLSRARRRLENETAYRHGLNPLQLNILLSLARAGKKRLTVGFLAEELEVSEPTLSDSLRSLQNKGYVRKKVDASDRRLRYLELTASGVRMMHRCEEESRISLESFDARLLRRLSDDLHTLVAELFHAKFLRHARICKTCFYFSPATDDTAGFCRLLRKQLAIENLQYDCPDHTYADTHRDLP